MSNFDQKVEVVTNFLVTRAQLGRVTTFSEVAAQAGQALYERGYRSNGSARPVSREKLADVLAAIASRSVKDNGFILPAIVLHAQDNGAGHRFIQWALDNNVMDGSDNVATVHRQQVNKVFANYGGDKQMAYFLIDVDVPADTSALNLVYAGPRSDDEGGDYEDSDDGEE